MIEIDETTFMVTVILVIGSILVIFWYGRSYWKDSGKKEGYEICRVESKAKYDERLKIESEVTKREIENNLVGMPTTLRKVFELFPHKEFTVHEAGKKFAVIAEYFPPNPQYREANRKFCVDNEKLELKQGEIFTLEHVKTDRIEVKRKKQEEPAV